MEDIEAIIFDLGGTLVYWPDEDPVPRWEKAYRYLRQLSPAGGRPESDGFVRALVEAERLHWERVVEERWSGPPDGLVRQGFRLMGLTPSDAEVLAVLDAYSTVTEGVSAVYPDAAETLDLPRRQGYRLGLLSNTWWAAAWHDAELAVHGLAPHLDTVVYTSDLPHSKPHPSVFAEVAGRLGVEPKACVMVGDRPLDDIHGALGVGMRAIWKRNEKGYPGFDEVIPTATIYTLAEIPLLLQRWSIEDSGR